MVHHPAARRRSRKPRALARFPQRAIVHHRRPGPRPWSRNRCVQPRHSLSRERSSDCSRSIKPRTSVSCSPPNGPGRQHAVACLPQEQEIAQLPAAGGIAPRFKPAEAKLVDQRLAVGEGVRVPRFAGVGDGVEKGQRRMPRIGRCRHVGHPRHSIASIASAFRHVAPVPGSGVHAVIKATGKMPVTSYTQPYFKIASGAATILSNVSDWPQIAATHRFFLTEGRQSPSPEHRRVTVGRSWT
jgi:hypothetical protein